MFYQFTKESIGETAPEKISEEFFTAGYLSVGDLISMNPLFGFDENTINACRDANAFFRSGVEVHDKYTFTELRIMNAHEEDDDYIALFLKKNFMLVVDISDEDGSTKNKYLSAIGRYSPGKANCEKVLAAFLDSLLSGDHGVLEAIEFELTEQEEALLEKHTDKDFSINLLRIKKELSKRHSYYAQLLDIADAVYENDNDIFEDANLMYVDNVSKRIARLREDTMGLISTVDHLQDAYSSFLDSNMNNTMKIFTVLTSIFFPLTIIVGWYGMNFQYMLEFGWRFGYIYVIALSVVTVLVFAIIGKRKKWF